MAIVKLTNSKKAVQFICDEGVVYQTSVAYLKNLITGEVSGRYPVGVLSRLPMKVSKDRFKQSPVWGADKYEDAKDTDNLTTNDDVFSRKGKNEREESDMYTDKVVW